ncbi:MAG: Anti-sigma-K factor rskA [Friedmanniella sp.]|nr:Anti-sigma-K factor rskA [Friedmanniella sp.]
MHTNPETLALLALGELETMPEDRHHIDGCPLCQAELAELTHVVDRARQTTGEDAVLHAPSPELWDRIQNELELSGATSVPHQHLTAVGAGAAANPGRTSRVRRTVSFALAAAVLLAAGVGIGANLNKVTAPPAASKPVHLNALPQWPGSGGTAVLTTDAQGHEVLQVSMSSPEPATGRREVWLSDVDARHMRAMGYMDGNTGTFPIPEGMDVRKWPVIDISEEPVPDTSPAHSGNSIVRGRLPV